MFQNIDHMAHLAGFLAGLAFVALETVRRIWRSWQTGGEPCSGASRLFWRPCSWRPAGSPSKGRVIQPVIARSLPLSCKIPSLSPVLLNNLAWKVATSPAASQAQLALALRGIERAVESDPRDTALRDTRATVLYRLHQWQEAVGTEYSLIATNRTPFYVSQVARFEWALVRDRGPLFLGHLRRCSPARGSCPTARFCSTLENCACLRARSSLRAFTRREGLRSSRGHPRSHRNLRASQLRSPPAPLVSQA